MTSTVRFVEAITQPAGGKPDLSSLLGRVLYSKHGVDDPQQVLRAMVCSAIGSGHHPASVRHFVLGTPRAAYLVPLLARSSWYPLVASARSYLAAVNDADGGARAKRLPWARIGIARAVSPLPLGHGLSSRMQVRVRITILLMAARALETGYDNLLATAGWLAQEMNVTGAQAARVLVVMEKKLNWIRRVRGGGMGIRYRFVALNTSELREAAWRYNVTIDALADNRPDDDELALLISLIRNPSWAYSEQLGHRAWLRLALPHMPTAENRLGLSPASYRKLNSLAPSPVTSTFARRLMNMRRRPLPCSSMRTAASSSQPQQSKTLPGSWPCGQLKIRSLPTSKLRNKFFVRLGKGSAGYPMLSSLVTRSNAGSMMLPPTSLGTLWSP